MLEVLPNTPFKSRNIIIQFILQNYNILTLTRGGLISFLTSFLQIASHLILASKLRISYIRKHCLLVQISLIITSFKTSTLIITQDNKSRSPSLGAFTNTILGVSKSSFVYPQPSTSPRNFPTFTNCASNLLRLESFCETPIIFPLLSIIHNFFFGSTYFYYSCCKKQSTRGHKI
ncbi:hypothetical protein ACOSQ2_007212 [Xanthoceras sorbifolium]